LLVAKITFLKNVSSISVNGQAMKGVLWFLFAQFFLSDTM